MATASVETQRFDKLSKQRIDFKDLPNGGVRAKMTIRVPVGDGKFKDFRFVEDMTPEDVSTYEAQVAGMEIGIALQEVGYFGGSVYEVGFLGSIIKAVGKGVKAVGKGIAKGAKAVAKVAKAVVTSKVMQTAAKGLAMVAPALGPYAPIAMGVAGGIGVAGKLLSAKNAEAVGAQRTAVQLAQGAVSDAQRISPTNSKSLLQIARDKAASAARLAGLPQATHYAQAAASAAMVPSAFAQHPSHLPGSRMLPSGANLLQLAQLGRVQSNRGGRTTPAELQLASNSGRLFFVAA